MHLLTSILIAAIAALHLYFLYFEMFAWDTIGRKTFKQIPADIFPHTKALAANQGLYNGFLVAGLVWSLFISDQLWADYVAIFFSQLCLSSWHIWSFDSQQKNLLDSGDAGVDCIGFGAFEMRRWRQRCKGRQVEFPRIINSVTF